MASDRRSIMSILTLTVTVMLAVLVIWPTQLDAYYTQNTGCHHNGSWYADKSLVPTTEKCLNCQCNKKTLVCRLKVCPEMPMPPPRGCVVVQQKNTCCPYLSCARLDAFYKIPSTRRIIAYLDHYERESIDRVVNENVLQRRSDDTDVDLYVCVKNGTVYKSGSAMSSSNLCSYCYCIGGTEKCVKPKCMLPLEGCKPIFVDSTCCPVRYDCSTKQTGKSSQEVRYRKTSNKHYMRMSQRPQRNRGCTVGQQFYAEGQKMKSDKDRPCDICFCIRGQRKCAPKKCAPALRNCIPVVPKGQCCPSSYDCGSQRDYRRSQNSRQFNLFSLLFGKDEDQETAEGTQIAVEYPPDRHPGVVEKPLKPKPASHAVDESNGTNIFDTIREGLELIDGNNKQMLKDNTDLVGIQPTPTPIPLGLIQRPSTTTTEISFLDLILGPSDPNQKEEESSSEEIGSQQKSTPSGLSWVDLLLAPNEDLTLSSTVSDKVDHTPAPRINDLTDFDSSTSIDRLDYTNATESEENLGVLKAEDLDNIFLTTIKDIRRTEPTTAEDTTQTLPTTLSDTTEETQSTEPIRTDLVETTKKPIEEVVPSSTAKAETVLNPTTEIPSVSLTKVQNVSQKVESLSLDHKHVPLQNSKPEKRPDFFSALLDGLSDILQADNKTKNPLNVQTTKIPKAKINITSTLSLPTPKPLPHFKPLPTDKTYTRINSKIANLTVKPPIVSTKDILNTTFKPLPLNLSKNPIIPISEGLYQSSTIKTTTIMSTTPMTTNVTSTTATKSTDAMTTLKPVVIKTNPTILEAEPYDQKTVPTLPPSLPNLKIIPFLPTDAVKDVGNKPAQFDFYHHSSDPTSRVDYDLYDDANIYPSITEKYPAYPDLEDGSKAEYIYKFNVEGPDASISSTAGKFDGTLGSPAFVKYDFTGSGLQKPKGFSPPTKTEGGFVPKDPLMQDDDRDNVSVKVGDSYQVTQHIIDITIAANMLNTTKVIEITTPDPFKDVIHTEPPPDLTSLIEDKLKSSIAQANASTNASSKEHQQQQTSTEAHVTTDSYANIPTNDDAKRQEEELGAVNEEIAVLNDSKQKLTKEYSSSPKYPSPQYVMSNTTDEVKGLYEAIKSHNLESTHVVSTIPPFKSLPEAVIEELDKEDSILTTMQPSATKTMIPTTTSRALPITTARIPMPISIGEIYTTNKASLVTTSKRPAIIWHNNRNKTIANTTSKTIPNKYGPQHQQQLPLAFTKNKQTGHAEDIGTATETKVLSSTSSYASLAKTKGNITRRISNGKPTKHNTRPTNRPFVQASTSTHMSNGPTTIAAKEATKVNATIDEQISDEAFKRTGSVAGSNKTKTTYPTKKATTKIPIATTTTAIATATIPIIRITKPSISSSSTSWITTSIPKSFAAISTTQNPFLMSPFDKLPFMDASFEVKRNSATPSFSASMQAAGQTPSAPIPSAELSYNPPSFSSTSTAHSSANHPKLMGLVHYKHTLNQLEGLEHSSLGTAQPFAAHSDFIEVSTSSSLYPGNIGVANGPQAQHQQQQQQLSSQLNSLIDPTGILKLAGCNIYGRMYRVGRIILELSTPCMECKCTEIGVKCGPLDC